MKMLSFNGKDAVRTGFSRVVPTMMLPPIGEAKVFSCDGIEITSGRAPGANTIQAWRL